VEIMKKRTYEEYHETVAEMVRTMGIESTDDYLKQELSNITKSVVHLREKIVNMKDSIIGKTNADELNHLKYDIEDAADLLNNLLQKLKTADRKYICFKEYLRREKIGCHRKENGESNYG
jgi:predicted  nucleic acid-binding Zn-ribbon protein